MPSHVDALPCRFATNLLDYLALQLYRQYDSFIDIATKMFERIRGMRLLNTPIVLATGHRHRVLPLISGAALGLSSSSSGFQNVGDGLSCIGKDGSCPYCPRCS